jgi:hypothetical protein
MEKRTQLLVIWEKFEHAVSEITNAGMCLRGEPKHDDLVFVARITARIIEDAHRYEAIVAFVKIRGGFILGLMDHGWFSFCVLSVNHEGSDFPSARSRGKGIKLREGLSSRSEVGKTGPAGEGQYNGWREPDGGPSPADCWRALKSGGRRHSGLVLEKFSQSQDVLFR